LLRPAAAAAVDDEPVVPQIKLPGWVGARIERVKISQIERDDIVFYHGEWWVVAVIGHTTQPYQRLVPFEDDDRIDYAVLWPDSWQETQIPRVVQLDARMIHETAADRRAESDTTRARGIHRPRTIPERKVSNELLKARHYGHGCDAEGSGTIEIDPLIEGDGRTLRLGDTFQRYVGPAEFGTFGVRETYIYDQIDEMPDGDVKHLARWVKTERV
jgi:hypothetical protein